MLDQANLDLKIILLFTTAYEKKYQEGELSEDQLDQILSLLDNYQQYSPSRFKDELNKIFQKAVN